MTFIREVVHPSLSMNACSISDVTESHPTIQITIPFDFPLILPTPQDFALERISYGQPIPYYIGESAASSNTPASFRVNSLRV